MPFPVDIENIITGYLDDPLQDIRYEFHHRLELGNEYFLNMGCENRYYPMSKKIINFFKLLFNSIVNFRYNIIYISEWLDSVITQQLVNARQQQLVNARQQQLVSHYDPKFLYIVMRNKSLIWVL